MDLLDEILSKKEPTEPQQPLIDIDSIFDEAEGRPSKPKSDDVIVPPDFDVEKFHFGEEFDKALERLKPYPPEALLPKPKPDLTAEDL